LAAAWAGGLLANAMRVRRSLLLQPGALRFAQEAAHGAAAAAATSPIHYYKKKRKFIRVQPLCA